MQSSKLVFSLILGLTLLLIPSVPSIQALNITIDGDMTDWDGIPSLVEDSSNDTGPVGLMNLIGAQVTNNSNSLFIRMNYAFPYEFLLLFGNVTIRNKANDIFVLMAFVTGDNSQNNTWVFPGLSLNTSQNDPTRQEEYTEYPGYAAVSTDYTSIEFKIPFADIDSGNSSNISEIDFVFWHYDLVPAGNLELNQIQVEDRVPDSGYVTYYSGSNQQISSSRSSKSSTSTLSTPTSSESTSHSIISSSTEINDITDTTDNETSNAELQYNFLIFSLTIAMLVFIPKYLKKNA